MEKFLMGFVALLLFKVCFSLRVFTPRNENYAVPLASKGLTFTNITQLRFKLKACTDGHIFLQEDKVANLYSGSWTFALGVFRNTKSEILKSPINNKRYSMHREAVLNCNQFRPFWIRWKGGLLELGKGSEFGTDRICVHTITPVNFNYVFLLTGWESFGCWDIDIDTGNTPSLFNVLTSSWQKVSGNQKLHGQNLISYYAKSLTECNLQCVTPSENVCACVEYSYNKFTKQCLLGDEGKDRTIVTATGWRTWHLM